MTTGQQTTNATLLRRMAKFLVPVKGIAAMACAMVVAWMITDVSVTRMTGNVANAIQAAAEEREPGK